MATTEKDLFSEEDEMVAMSFGEHLEELRVRLVLALLGLAVGVILTFIPPLSLGQRVLVKMQDPATDALAKFYKERSEVRSKDAAAVKAETQPFAVEIDAEEFAKAVAGVTPGYKAAAPESLKGKKVPLTFSFQKSSFITTVADTAEQRGALISLAPLEAFMIYFSVCMVTGLVIASPWVFYQIWAFVAAGLYRHERHYVSKFLPFSIGLFLGGVFLCFFLVLPYTLSFLLEFNVWLGIEPTLRISEWISFATIMPLVFGACFQTPLVMLFLSRLGIVSQEVMRANRKYAVLIMVVVAAVITPTGDPFTLGLLAVPMIMLYELGLVLIGRTVASVPSALN